MPILRNSAAWVKTAPDMSAPIEDCIRTVRGLKVIVDADLARIYGVPTKVLNQAVKRNAERFPEDFCFRPKPVRWRAAPRHHQRKALIHKFPRLQGHKL